MIVSFATMSKIYTTGISSAILDADNPIHQRLLVPYLQSQKYAKGDLLEVGCGNGRGVDYILPFIRSYTAIDRTEPAILPLQKKYPNSTFVRGAVPPMPFADNSFDTVISFQVIEHIKEDRFFLKEVLRILRPSGFVLITTPNRPMSLSRNPWHVREYTTLELTKLAQEIFSQVTVKGISGNESVMKYYEQNKKSVQKIMKWDILDLQHRLPASMLRLPYEVLNRLNRNNLKKKDGELVKDISTKDFFILDDSSESIDLFMIAKK